MSYKWYAYCHIDDLYFDDVNDCEYAAFTFIYTINLNATFWES